MALPGNVLATQDFPAEFIGGRALSLELDRDFETGGVALSDPSEGHLVQVWETYVAPNLIDIVIKDEAGNETIIYEGTDLITEISCTFDQNMRQTFAFVEGGIAKLDWYDTQLGARTVTIYSDIDNPRVSLDDKRATQMDSNDIIFAYIKNGNLYHRRQRDRYQTEYLLAENVLPDTENSILRRIGLNNVNRFQFEIFTPWTQEEILEDLVSRAADPYIELSPPYQVSATVSTILTAGTDSIWGSQPVIITYALQDPATGQYWVDTEGNLLIHTVETTWNG